MKIHKTTEKFLKEYKKYKYKRPKITTKNIFDYSAWELLAYTKDGQDYWNSLSFKDKQEIVGWDLDEDI
mgnify:CR=1 FL=1